MESRRRSVAKVISWRFTATVTTTIISFLITGKIDMAIKIGVFEVFAKLLLQYFHERLWNRFSFGVSKKSLDYQI